MQACDGVDLYGRSLKHADGREFWVLVRRLRAQYLSCGTWPTCSIPEGRPQSPTDLMNTIARFATLHGGQLIQLLEPTCIPKLEWSYNNWSQLEICTRHLALPTEDFCEAYSSECTQVTGSIFDRRIKLVKHIKTLLNHILQMRIGGFMLSFDVGDVFCHLSPGVTFCYVLIMYCINILQ
jgi:hypothetical protein